MLHTIFFPFGGQKMDLFAPLFDLPVEKKVLKLFKGVVPYLGPKQRLFYEFFFWEVYCNSISGGKKMHLTLTVAK